MAFAGYSLLAFAILIFLGGCLFSGPRYRGPKSDHFNGKRFINPGGVQAKGLGDVIGWAIKRKKGPWPPKPENNQPGPKPPASVPGKDLKITFINHSSVLIQTQGINILCDPIWAKRASPFQWAGPRRMRNPGIRFEDLPNIDVVLLSHNHYDHLCLPTLRRLLSVNKPLIVTPLGVAKYLSNRNMDAHTDMDWWQSLSLPGGLTLTCVPAQHFSARGTMDRDATLWCGYVISGPSGNIYFAGDSGYGSFFNAIGEKFGTMRAALIPIGAYVPEWFMSPIHISPKQAAQVHKDVHARQSIAIHHGTFPLADDSQQQPITDLHKALSELQIPQEAFIVLKEGEGILIPE
jgi:L-ascorbate metabolism protein UlaG (beta-lactamase superfamily)